MGEEWLAGKRVLVVEDEYILADDLSLALEDASAEVVGPAPRTARALALLGENDVDAAVLDINLGGEMSFTVADALATRGVPFLFTTGYDAAVLPDRFDHVVRCEKPVDMRQIMRALQQVMQP